METQPGSVMARLRRVPDPRRREGRRYPLPGLLGMLTLAAIDGEGSLRGMWLWGCGHWKQIAGALDLWATEGPPSYGTLRNLLAAIDAEQLNEALCPERSEEEGITIDGKVLRGSKRVATPALQVITVAGHRYRTVLAQGSVTGQDMIEAATTLLHEMPLEDKIVSMDAGLLQRTVVKTIVEKGGPTWGRSRAIMANSTQR
jgi:hypothetical protein